MKTNNTIDRCSAMQVFVDTVNVIKAVTNDAKDVNKYLERVRNFIPKFTCIFTFKYLSREESHENTSVRHFTYIDGNDSGKSRIYVSKEKDKQDLYMFYISKEHLTKMITDPSDSWFMNIFKDRWVITAGRWKFKDPYQLIYSTLAVEASSSKKNKPPVSCNPHPWIGPPSILNRASKYRMVGTTFGGQYSYFNVTLQEYSFQRECQSIIT